MCMSRRDPMVRVHHRLDHAREAVEMVRHRTRADLDADRLLHLAGVRLMEVVGEAATHSPEEFRARYPDVPWRDVADLRKWWRWFWRGCRRHGAFQREAAKRRTG